MNDHKTWVKNATGDSIRAVARKLGINEGNFNGKVNTGLTAELVMRVADAYGISRVQALIDTGHLPPREAHQETAEEIAARIERDVRTLAEMAGEKSNIVQFRPRREYDPTQGIPNDAVADSSPDTEGDLDDLDP